MEQQQTSAGLPSVAELDNDTRGWIMCIVSGIACVLGASIICVDVVVRQFPGRRDFRIENSNVFLACSLSLSFGVMLFSALYSMLPSAREYLERAGFSGQAAGLILMTCFVAGFLGIQAVSRVLHQFMPSHVVDCDHSHDEPAALEAGQTHRSCSHGSRQASRSRSVGRKGSSSRQQQQQNINGHPHDHDHHHNRHHNDHHHHSHHHHNHHHHHHHLPPHHASHEATPLLRSSTAISAIDRRPSILQVQKRVMSFVRDTKSNCDEMGPCYGYTDPCGQECFKHLPVRAPGPGPRHSGRVSFQRTTTGSFYDDVDQDYLRTSRAQSSDIPPEMVVPEHDPSCSSASSDPNPDEDDDDEEYVYSDGDRYFVPPFRERHHCRSHSSTSPPPSPPPAPDPTSTPSAPAGDPHHHHVPTNAFMSIGLQTSIAIALHKFPEGFITYATNHANPALGFAVFMALFVHNISEGFAMALPLYMALGSRARAMAWAAALGGLSQPLGAGLAVLWFRVARGVGSAGPSALFYAGLFAVTAGIMVSVALQLFVESLSLNHNRNLSIFFGFLGMVLLGFSGALVGDGH